MIARYRSRYGAEKYAAELNNTFPEYKFVVCNHPTEFAYTVTMEDLITGRKVYAGKRPPGGPRKRYPVDSDGYVHPHN